jgi:sugar phosphate permease
MTTAEGRLATYLRPTAANRVLWLLCLMYLILYIDRVNIATAAPDMRRDLGLSNADYGWAVSAFAIPYAAFQLIGGWLGDRVGARRTLSVGGLIVCAATALTGAVSRLWSLFLARLALGVGEGAAFPTATRAVAAWTPRAQWGYAQGITHCFARLGNAVAPPIVAALIAWISWRGSFVIAGAASLIWVMVWAWYFRDDPRSHPHVSAGELAELPGASRRSSEATMPWPEWRRLAWYILPVTVVDFCYGTTLWLFLTWIPSYFYENFQLNLGKSALNTMIVLFGGVIGDTLGGVISDWRLRRTGNLRRARCDVIAAGLLGAVLFLVPVVVLHELWVAVAGLALAFFCSELVVAPIWSVPMDIAPRHAGTASGMMNLGFGISGIISPPLFGKLVDTMGWTYPFLCVAMLLLIGGSLALKLRPDLPFEQAAETSA